MLIELSKLSIFELLKIDTAVGTALFIKAGVPLLFILAVTYALLWLTDKKMC